MSPQTKLAEISSRINSEKKLPQQFQEMCLATRECPQQFLNLEL